MDNEVYELCREVYEKTGWNAPHDKVFVINDAVESDTGIKKPSHFLRLGYGKRSGVITYWPLYTSDYLLEKLPKEIVWNFQELGIEIGFITQTDEWSIGYRNKIDGKLPIETRTPLEYTTIFEVKSNTPLKALLKLTIALYEAGEL